MKRPTVISEKKYGASWFMPAGESYMANLFRDAGADYLFKNLSGSGSKPLAFETVLNEAIHADRWLMKYNLSEEMSYATYVWNILRMKILTHLKNDRFILVIRGRFLTMLSFLYIRTIY